MQVEDINNLLAGITSAGGVHAAIKSISDDPMIADLTLALGGEPSLMFLRHLPLAEIPIKTRYPWSYFVDSHDIVGAAAARLDALVDSLHHPLVVSRVADLVWWTSPELRSFERHAQRGMQMHLTVARSFAEPTDRLAACWAGCELALATDTHAVRNELRELAIRSAFDLVLAPYSSPEVVGLRMDRGLMFLYGLAAAWDPLPIGRELTAITEIAERRSRLPLSMTGLMPAIHWVHRLRYIAADSEDERVRVVEEMCADRRASVFNSPFLGSDVPPLMGTSELSRAIEDAAACLARTNKKPLRDRLDRLTKDLVLDLQRLGWQHTSARTSLVSPEDVSQDARDAEKVWRVSDRDPTIRTRLRSGSG